MTPGAKGLVNDIVVKPKGEQRIKVVQVGDLASQSRRETGHKGWTLLSPTRVTWKFPETGVPIPKSWMVHRIFHGKPSKPQMVTYQIHCTL